jgi:hypothetical protein
MDPIVALLLAWIGDNSDYDTACVQPPQIVEMSLEELTAEYYGAVPHLLPDDGVDDRLNALYAANDGPDGTIYLLKPELIADAQHFDMATENPLYREILLHELTHHVQWQTGEAETWDCQSYGEREAYILGGRYLRQTRTEDPLPNRMFWAHVYARC